MKERKTYDLRLPKEMVEQLRMVKKLRSQKEGRRVTWNELMDEILSNYIECAEKLLADPGMEGQDDGR